ncbi:hypothetical protein GJAV_G00086080 [Gymnothorax javanicus]|nr:hypothetical protein GJAV_G00086080 [Gymnothorax javanicus]
MIAVARTVDGEPSVAIITQLSLSSSSRTCSILLSNCSSSILINPQVHTNNGYCCSPPDLTVDKGARSIFAFGNGAGSNSGAVGVMTYDITQNRKMKAHKRLAIMFSVPNNYNRYENWIAMGLFDVSQPCDDSLYQQMYYNSGPFRREKSDGSEISYESEKYIIRGAMTPMSKAEMKVELWDKE